MNTISKKKSNLTDYREKQTFLAVGDNNKVLEYFPLIPDGVTNELCNIRNTDGNIIGDLQIGSDGFIELAFVILITDEKTKTTKSYIYKLKKKPDVPHAEIKTNDDLMTLIIEESDDK